MTDEKGKGRTQMFKEASCNTARQCFVPHALYSWREGQLDGGGYIGQ